MTDIEQKEKTIIEAFTFFYRTSREGLVKGNLAPVQHLELLDRMAHCFRDYLISQRSEVEAQMAIEKIKNATSSKSN